jgi:ribosome biogenesis protein BMS1
MVGKGHRKKKAGRKAAKKKAAKKSTGGGDGIDSDLPSSNPRAGQLASKGRARVARARTAEKEQRRLHGVSTNDNTCSTQCMHALQESCE